MCLTLFWRIVCAVLLCAVVPRGVRRQLAVRVTEMRRSAVSSNLLHA
jgi:hypothetical protein